MRLSLFSLSSLGLYLLTALMLFSGKPSSRVSVPLRAAKPPVLANYGKLPLSYEANQGQTDEQVKFLNVLGERPAGKAWAELPAASSAHILKAKGTNLPEGLSPAEWSEIQRQVRASEYELAPAEPETPEVRRTAWQALNRAQDLRTFFSEDGIQVVPRREAEPSWEWGLTLKSYGYQGRTRPVGTAERVAGGNRIEYRRGDLTEWYVNEERGLEQGFTLAAPPGARGEDLLSIELDLSGTLVPKLTEDGTAILFADRGGRTILRYSGLLAWDAGGQELPARMAVERGKVSIRVDDRGAVYPVTIDPIVTQEVKLTASDAAAGDQFGFSVAVDGDTVVVGARLDDDVASDSGSAYVFVRSGTSWSEQAELKASDAEIGDLFGESVAVDGNTVVVGAGQDASGSKSGSAYVFRAPALALDPASFTFGDQAVGTALLHELVRARLGPSAA